MGVVITFPGRWMVEVEADEGEEWLEDFQNTHLGDFAFAFEGLCEATNETDARFWVKRMRTLMRKWPDKPPKAPSEPSQD